MATLTDTDRFDIWQKWMFENAENCSISKAELRGAVDAIDQWVDDNTAAFNSSIPQPARGALSTKQKARIFMEVVNRRFIVP